MLNQKNTTGYDIAKQRSQPGAVTPSELPSSKPNFISRLYDKIGKSGMTTQGIGIKTKAKQQIKLPSNITKRSQAVDYLVKNKGMTGAEAMQWIEEND